MWHGAQLINDGYAPLYFIVNGENGEIYRKANGHVRRFRSRERCLSIVDILNGR